MAGLIVDIDLLQDRIYLLVLLRLDRFFDVPLIVSFKRRTEPSPTNPIQSSTVF